MFIKKYIKGGIIIMQILAIIGIIGGIICSISDCLLDIKGKDNIKLGKHKYIESKWDTMNPNRFLFSSILVMFAVPMFSCGFLALMSTIYDKHQTLSTVLSIIFLLGAMGGFMIHTVLCLVPRIYQVTIKKSNFELAEELLDKIFKQIMIPFIILYSSLVIIPAIAVMILIITGILPLPLWCILLNPIIFQIIGLLLRRTKLSMFVDAPSIFAASLGISMYGVLALVLL